METGRGKDLKKKWNKMLILINLLYQKVMIQHQAAKAVGLMTTVKIPLSSFSKITPTTAAVATVPATQGTLQFLLSGSLKILIGAKITDRNGVYILMVGTEASRHNTENLGINHTSFQCLRKIFREARQI